MAPSIWRRMFPEFFEPRKLSARQGMNRFVWDLRLADPHLVDDAVLWGSARGPEVPPGAYQARLSVEDWSMTVSVEVAADPRLEVAQAAHAARFALARRIWEGLERSHDVIRQARSVRKQVSTIAEVGGNGAISDAAQALSDQLTAVEEKVLQTRSKAPQDILNFTPMLDNQFVNLMSVVESAPGEPTAASYELFEELDGELAAIEAELARILGEDLEAFQGLVDGAALDRVIVPGGAEQG
jgi:hypothetical protein